jgi:hypothetical protein
MLGDLAMQIEIGRLLVMKAAWEIDRAASRRRRCRWPRSMWRTCCTRPPTSAIQINGARGYSKDTVLEWIYRYARQARLVDGADEVHKMVLNRHLDPSRVREFYRWATLARYDRRRCEGRLDFDRGRARDVPPDRLGTRRGRYALTTGSAADSRTRPIS